MVFKDNAFYAKIRIFVEIIVTGSPLESRRSPFFVFIHFPFCEHGYASVTCPRPPKTGEPGAPSAVRNM